MSAPANKVDVLGVPARVIRVAACLAERYSNSDVAAFGRIGYCGAENRMWSGKFRRVKASPCRDRFWRSVALLLGAAYTRYGCPTDYEIAARRAIEEARRHV